MADLDQQQQQGCLTPRCIDHVAILNTQMEFFALLLLLHRQAGLPDECHCLLCCDFLHIEVVRPAINMLLAPSNICIPGTLDT